VASKLGSSIESGFRFVICTSATLSSITGFPIPISGTAGPFGGSEVMKSILNLVAVCALVALAGCSSTSNTASPGAVGEKSDCSASCTQKCTGEKTDASMGAVGEKKAGCCSQQKAASDASMGAVGEKKSGCCSEKKAADASLGAVSEKSGCTKTCPMTGKTSG